MKFADSVNRAAFFRMFGTCSSHADGCGLCCTGGDDCITTHDNLTRRTGVPAVDCNNQSGPTGPPGHDWHACNFTCPPAPSVQNGAHATAASFSLDFVAHAEHEQMLRSSHDP